jgi:hypothetical protein
LNIKDFVVEVRHGQRGSLEVHVVSSPASGETSGPFVLSPEMEEMLARQGGLRGIISNPRAASQRDLDGSNLGMEPCRSAEVVGTALFRSLFPPAVRSLFDQSYGALKDGQSGLRIKLRFDLQDPELARLHALPWELLCQPETKRFLCLDRQLPVVRYLEVPTGVALMAVPSPLRILVVMANPSGLPQLDVEKERKLLDAAWSNHQGIEIEVLEDPDPSRLHAYLAQGPWHVLHFMGHGVFDATAGAGVLDFVGPQGNPLPLSGVALADLLRNFLPELRLVVLNACNTALTAAPSGLDPFSGVAAALMKGGLPAVLAMQAPIRDQAAISFSSVFYRHLAAGDPVDVAAAHGRLEIYLSDQGSAEWATPVLFMRVPDGRLFAPLSAVESGCLVYDDHIVGPDGREAWRARLTSRELLQPYLDWMIERHSVLELRGLRHHGRIHLPLEKVFVALKGDRTHPFERAQARLALERELEAVLESGQFSLEEIQAARWSLVASSSSVMPSLETRDRPFVLPDEPAQTLTLGEAYRQHRRLVILGDPGSGKTTLARWLALTMARALRETPQRPVAVPLHQVDPEAAEGGEDDFLLGRPALPVLVRIAEYAEDRLAHKTQGKVPRTLTEFLGHHTWLTSVPTLGGGRIEPEALSGLILENLEKRAALVILDGLDEVPASIERDEILEEVHAFVRRWIGGEDRLLLSRGEGQVIGRIVTGSPEGWQGNRLIVTSRIAGYHASPLEVDFPHLTIEAMGNVAVDRFCDVWMQAVYEIERESGESDEAVRARGQAESAALKAEIHSPKRQRIRALASNPLLAGVLASVFHNEQAHLPEQRVRLYEAAVRHLTDVWQRRMQAGEAGLDEQEVLDLMAPIAAHIHQHQPTGLLGEKQLAELATRELALSRGEDPKKPSPAVRKAVRSFLRVLREDVGLLAARAEGVYGFLHLTFQEYLAARHLVQDLPTAGPKLMDKIDDPRWREPLLMAVGYVSLQWPGALPDLLRDLLRHEGELHDLLPRGALLITAALPEMAPLPDDLVRELSASLLRAYADREGLARFAELREVLERAFDRLRGSGYEKPLEEALRSALRGEKSGETSLAPAAAALVERLEWYSPRLVQALMDALPDDTPSWDWPVDQALRKAITPPAPEVPGTPRAPKDDPLLPQARRELEQTRDEERRQELQKHIARLEERHEKAVREFEQRKEEFDQQLKAYATLELPLRCRIPTASLPFRTALEGNPELVQRIVQSPGWLRLVLALYGGMRDYETPASILEYEQIAAYLQLSDNERTAFITFYKERWGGEDTVYDMATYLDERAGRMNKVWKEFSRFAAANIYQDSRLTRLLLDALEAHRAAETLIPQLWRIWRTGKEAATQAEALVALLALGEEVGSALREAATDSALREAANAASRKLSRLSQALDDPVTRASPHVIPGLKILAEKLEPRRWSAAVAAVIATTMFHGARSIGVHELLIAPDDEQLSYVLAEFLASRILGTTDDAVVHAATMAESLCKSCWSPELLISALGRVSESRYLKLGTYQFGWQVETLAPRTMNRNDIPLAVLENLESIHPDLGFVRGAFLQHLLPVLERNPDLLPEVLALNLGSRGDNESRESTHRVLYPPLVGHPAPWSEIERMANATKSPYHRARALLRLAEHRPQTRESLVAGARSAIERIQDPHQKEQVLERLIQWSPTERRAALVKDAMRLVPKIRPLEDQVRALGRLTRYLPSQQGEALLKEALAKVTRLGDEALRAETLRALMPLLPAYPALLIRAQALADEMTSPWCRSLARDLHGAQLLPLHAALAGVSADSPDLWAPLVLSALIRDGEQHAELSPEQLWLRLGRNPGPRELAALRGHALAEGLVLTRTAAQILDRLLEARGNEPMIESILPLLEHQEMDTLPIVEGWLDHPNAMIARYAALCFSEDQGLSQRTVRAILELLQDEQDLWRHRAARLIHHPSVTPDEPTRTLSGLGRETVEFLTQESIRRHLDAPQVSLMISWLNHDLIHDSAEIFEQWLRSVDHGGAGAAVAQSLLRGIEAMTEPVWEVFLAGLRQNRPAVQIALLTSLCRLQYKERVKKERVLKRISDEQWASFLTAIPDMILEPLAEHRISTAGPLELVQAARQALDQREGLSDGQAVALVGDLLRKLFSTSFADILRLDSEAMKKEMKAVAALALYSPNPDVQRATREAAVQLKEDQELFRFALLWLAKLLQDSVQDSRFDSKRSYLLQLMAAAAELAPATFSNLADPEELEPLLILTVKCHNNYTGRVAAVTLLGFLRRVTTEGVEALHAALKDVIYVQQSALDAVLRFRRLDGEILPLLFEGLYHPSAMAGYATAQLLAALGRSDRTHPEQRRQILRALADAVRDPRSDRVVYFGYVNARIQALPRLNHSYYRAMMQVAGIE